MRSLRSLLLLAPVALAGLAGLAPPPGDQPSDDRFPPVTQRDTGPESLAIDSIARHYGPVAFDHRLHVNMTELTGDCRACHHQTEEDDPITACSECHAAASDDATFERPSLKGAFHRQCLGCHRDWSHSNACLSCHQETSGQPGGWIPPDPTDTVDAPHAEVLANATYTYLTAHEPMPTVTFHHADHTEVFGLRCSDCHQGASCNACHGPDAAPRSVNRVESCYSCHSDQNCVLCHSPAERPRFDHAGAVGWSLEPSHHEVPCADCHGPERAFITPASARCVTCHQCPEMPAGAHADPDVPLAGSHAYFDCVACHRGGDAASIAECAHCHDGMSYPDFLPGLARPPEVARPARPVITDESIAGM